ncbi:hypothetical protein EXIGLDRAFT_836317 [Exidia glandulosa HHB12029]|uniref:Mitochondrial DNA polymerase catalytic subunit n=1 Tax=Exidia glandulosa HHB12029 TaxID=1314781 RepID=A0A165HXX6_EXIGL|nr:hypothetical protein EXIGLDRAFT_836317 [Exidia glandulosa HHB12029]
MLVRSLKFLESAPARRRALSALAQLPKPPAKTTKPRPTHVDIRPTIVTPEEPKVDLPKRNAVGVQLLSRRLHEQIFPHEPFPTPPNNFISIAKEHLKLHGLDPKQGSNLPDLAFTLPQLHGASIDEHFHNIGSDVAKPYLDLATQFAQSEFGQTPSSAAPTQWATTQSGWTKYYRGENAQEDYYVHVDCPDEQLLCFDVETLPHISPYAVMAVAVSPTNWYSWLSPWLLGESNDLEHLIPLGDPSVPRIVVGHNVSYDRQRIREEYSLERSASRFLDTMSLHVAIKGISSHQRPAWNKWKKQKKETIEMVEGMIQDTREKFANGVCEEDELVDLQDSLEQLQNGGEGHSVERSWEELTSANSLLDVAQLHCGITLKKAVRDDFLTATREEILEDVDRYLTYCAGDVHATHSVYRVVFPKFREACPSPVSFAGVLSMGSACLPVNQEWEKYLERAETKYRELEDGVKYELYKLAKDALLMWDHIDPATEDIDPKTKDKQRWQDDEWLSQLDWTPVSLDRTKKRSSVLPVIPTWLANVYKHPTGTTINTTVLPFILQMRYFNYPTFFAESVGWVYAIKKGETDESGAIASVPELDEELGSTYSFFSLYPKRKVKNPLSPSYGEKFLKSNSYSFFSTRATEVARGLTSRKIGLDRYVDEIFAVAQEVARRGRPQPVPGVRKGEPGDDTWWGDQLDWSPAHGSMEHTRPCLVPAWYRELLPVLDDEHMAKLPTVPAPEAVDVLDLTVRTRAAPLLLKLCWRGYPLFHSRAYGWMYRVPRAELHNVPAQEKERKFVVEHDVEKLSHLLPDFAFFKLPHKDGEEANVGNPLSKTFLKYALDGTLTSPSAVTRKALDMNAQSSYWISARDRVLNQVVVWQKDRLPMGFDSEGKEGEKWGLILPQVITMGTVTRRAIEKTWLTASNAKANRIGSELKAMVRAPPGYAIVGADVDSEELWISSVMGDAQFGLHGATAIGWMTLEGTKAAGTDLHSKTASILGISRNDAKVFNYSRIYGAGMKHASLLLLQSNPGMSIEKAQQLALELYARTKGRNTHRTDYFGRKFWFGGSESYVFNKLEEIAMSDRPQTPALGCGVTDALAKKNLPQTFGSDFLPSRINWVVQSSGVDYLHLLIVSMEHLLKAYDIKARYLISVHDELRYLVVEEDKYRLALALQIANLWTRCQFAYRLGMDDLPLGVAFFSAVDIDWLLRKEVDMPCITPSQPEPLAPGESLDMEGVLAKTNGGSLWRDGRPMQTSQTYHASVDYVPPDCMTHRAQTSHFLKAQATQELGEVKARAKLAKQLKSDSQSTPSTPRRVARGSKSTLS